MPEDTVNVRYMVHDVDAAVNFYTKHFGFTVGTNAAPAFADVFRGNLRLLLSGPSSSAGRPMPDGKKPGPGGWNRVEFVVDDIEGARDGLSARGLEVSEIQDFPWGRFVYFRDPDGNGWAVHQIPDYGEGRTQPDL